MAGVLGRVVTNRVTSVALGAFALALLASDSFFEVGELPEGDVGLLDFATLVLRFFRPAISAVVAVVLLLLALVLSHLAGTTAPAAIAAMGTGTSLPPWKGFHADEYMISVNADPIGIVDFGQRVDEGVVQAVVGRAYLDTTNYLDQAGPWPTNSTVERPPADEPTIEIVAEHQPHRSALGESLLLVNVALLGIAGHTMLEGFDNFWRPLAAFGVGTSGLALGYVLATRLRADRARGERLLAIPYIGPQIGAVLAGLFAWCGMALIAGVKSQEAVAFAIGAAVVHITRATLRARHFGPDREKYAIAVDAARDRQSEAAAIWNARPGVS